MPTVAAIGGWLLVAVVALGLIAGGAHLLKSGDE